MQLNSLLIGILKKSALGRQPALALGTLARIRSLQSSCTTGLNMCTERVWVVVERTKGCHGRNVSDSAPLGILVKKEKRMWQIRPLCLPDVL